MTKNRHDSLGMFSTVSVKISAIEFLFEKLMPKHCTVGVMTDIPIIGKSDYGIPTYNEPDRFAQQVLDNFSFRTQCLNYFKSSYIERADHFLHNHIFFKSNEQIF